jgi:hypothetical protein
MKKDNSLAVSIIAALVKMHGPLVIDIETLMSVTEGDLVQVKRLPDDSGVEVSLMDPDETDLI